MKNKLLNFYYRSFIYGLYLEFLLVLDLYLPRKKLKLTPKQISEVVREHSLTNEGVKAIKKRVNIVADTEGHENVLKDAGDLVPWAWKDPNSSSAKAVEFLKKNMDFSNKDIKTDLDQAKMVQKRIKDYEELHQHIEKRKALREARKNSNGKRN